MQSRMATIKIITGGFWCKVQPRDIIAVIILLALFTCKLLGLNGTIDAAIALIIGYYFSKRVFEEKNRK